MGQQAIKKPGLEQVRLKSVSSAEIMQDDSRVSPVSISGYGFIL
jgi:hypothetical protein